MNGAFGVVVRKSKKNIEGFGVRWRLVEIHGNVDRLKRVQHAPQESIILRFSCLGVPLDKSGIKTATSYCGLLQAISSYVDGWTSASSGLGKQRKCFVWRNIQNCILFVQYVAFI